MQFALFAAGRVSAIRRNLLGTTGAFAAGLMFAGSAGASPINLVRNGSFEMTTAYTLSGEMQVGTNVTSSNLSKWQVAGCGTAATCGFQFVVNSNLGTAGFYDQIDGHESTFYSTPGASPDGGNAFMSDGTYQNRQLTQRVAGLKIGDTYTLKFFQASLQQTGYSGASTDTWQVGLGNGTAFTAANYAMQYGAAMNNPTQSSTSWVQQSMTFVANATNETLFFFATASAGASPPFLLLDGVSLTDNPTTVPEPATLSLAAAGLVGLIAVRRRRNRVA